MKCKVDGCENESSETPGSSEIGIYLAQKGLCVQHQALALIRYLGEKPKTYVEEKEN
jgi:hypothetical protein